MPANSPTNWPVKRREFRNHHMNSTVWNDFRFRDDDIVIATYAKSGTTWMQQIVGQLIFSGREDYNLHKLSPWLDFRTGQREQVELLGAQEHRRFIKTHLPADALVISPQAKYIYVARDGRDTAWSLHNHHLNVTDALLEEVNDALGRFGPRLDRCSGDVAEFYRAWVTFDGYPYWSFWENVKSWWALRSLTNIMLIHFEDMKSDLAGSVRRISSFLGISASEELLSTVTEHSTFEYMKANAEKVTPDGGASWKGGAATFMNKGTNGRWRDTLGADEIAAYETKALAELGPECAAWLAKGGPLP